MIFLFFSSACSVIYSLLSSRSVFVHDLCVRVHVQDVCVCVCVFVYVYACGLNVNSKWVF
jgi:hypothetical protein